MRIRAPLKLADRLLFRKIARALWRAPADRCFGRRAAGQEPGPSSYEGPIGNAARFEGYGLTEGGVATYESARPPQAGQHRESRWAPASRYGSWRDGELLLKSPCLFSGYT